MAIAPHKTVQNAILLTATDVLTKILKMALTILLLHELDPPQIGLYVWGYTFSQLLLVLPGYGFARFTQREVARDPGRASYFFVNISVMKAVSYLPLAVLCALYAHGRVGSGEPLFIVMFIFLDAVLQHHTLFGCSFFRAIQRMEHEAVTRGLWAFFTTAVGFALIWRGYGLLELVVSRAAFSLVFLGVTVLWIRKDLALKLVRVSWKYCQILLRKSFPLAVLSILIVVYGSLNVVLLEFFTKGTKEVGYYSPADTIIGVFLFISAGVSTASFAPLSKFWRKSRESFHHVYLQSVRYILLISIPLTAGTLAFGDQAIYLVSGDKYGPSVAVLRILSFSLIPDFLGYIMSSTMVAMNRHRQPVIAAAIGSVVALVSCVVFIGLLHWGAAGAAAALVASTLAILPYQFHALRGILPVRIPVGTVIRATVATGIMVAALLPLNHLIGPLLSHLTGFPQGRIEGLPLIPVVIVAAPLYTALLIALRELKFHEVRWATGRMLHAARLILPQWTWLRKAEKQAVEEKP